MPLERVAKAVVGTLCLIVPLSFAVCARPAAVRADEPPAPAVEGERLQRRLPFRGFGYAKKGLKELCAHLESDGRREAIHKIAEANTARDESCAACRSLFLTLSSACVDDTRRVKPRPAARRKAAAAVEEGEEEGDAGSEPLPTPARRPLSREPSGEVVNAASIVFTSMAERERDLPESAKAVARLAFLLRDAGGKTKGEQEYMRILAEYAVAPFKRYFEASKTEESKKRKAGGPTQQDRRAADDLFAF